MSTYKQYTIKNTVYFISIYPMFSDCEGYIGSVVSKKLAQDFQDLEVIAKEKLEERDLNIFLEFKNAFELASHNGCVSFH
ncbi:hypothetical protein CKN63_13545 [Carnobacterium divergens]|nr:hypothetical protein CKN59_13545 [Carnobacterium divergens]TFI60478.1 hypothetical protein CKN76_13600 [Carnobacterium divergens]TFI77058.1 hypothetical protein CKN74_13020 [Carnobacterium divergens]TFJ00295.1 hypothetical protein CKN75_13435 [Carnobacterium divergens]TFJ09138.1 hypothetical protein CKN71_12485 [Carnobacterium divergens]